MPLFIIIATMLPNCAWNMGMRDAIQFIASTLHDGLSLQWWWDISPTEFGTSKNFLHLNLNARSSCVKIFMCKFL